MTNCQACGTEIHNPDRFCKNCGAPAAASVEDLADTAHFDPSAPAVATAQTGSLDPGSAFYTPANATYPMSPGATPSVLTASFIKHLLKRNMVWLLAFLLLFLFAGTGLVIGRDVIRARRAERIERAERAKQAELMRRSRQAEVAKRTLEETVQNAMGFVPAALSELEYPDTQGVFVTSLTSDGGPAAVAHFEAGDVLIELNDQPVRSGGELMQALNSLKPGSEVGVKLYRDGSTVASRIRVASQSVTPFEPKISPRDQGFLGVGDAGRRCCIPGSNRWGLEVHRVIDNSPADLMGLQPGDVITEFDKHIVRTADELARRIRNVKPRTKVKVRFYRGSAEQTVELIIGHGW
jgi:membrane-associated protease RseP (regulator of RpoE activity)